MCGDSRLGCAPLWRTKRLQAFVFNNPKAWNTDLKPAATGDKHILIIFFFKCFLVFLPFVYYVCRRALDKISVYTLGSCRHPHINATPLGGDKIIQRYQSWTLWVCFLSLFSFGGAAASWNPKKSQKTSITLMPKTTTGVTELWHHPLSQTTCFKCH